MIKNFSTILLLSLSTFHFSFADSSSPTNSATTANAPSQTAAVVQTNEPAQTPAKTSEQSKYQDVIDEYNKYLTTVDVKTREEIVRFRKEMVTISNQRKDLYKSLSQEAQLFLEKEKEYKKKLPINLKKEINS